VGWSEPSDRVHRDCECGARAVRGGRNLLSGSF
jgi:hypothetical protein